MDIQFLLKLDTLMTLFLHRISKTSYVSVSKIRTWYQYGDPFCRVKQEKRDVNIKLRGTIHAKVAISTRQ